MWADLENGARLTFASTSGDTVSRTLEVAERLNTSRTSVVYKVVFGSQVAALKIFHTSGGDFSHLDPGDLEVQDILERDREAEALQAIDGTAAPVLLSTGECLMDGEDSSIRATACLLMEFLEGETLTAWLEHHPTFEDRFRVLGSLADSLDEAHRRGVLQIDVASRNAIVAPSGRVKLVDFNASKLIRPVGPGVKDTTATHLNALVRLPPGHALEGPTITYEDLYKYGMPALDLVGFGRVAREALGGSLSRVAVRTRRSMEYFFNDLNSWETLQTWPSGELSLRWHRCAHGIDRLPELAPPSRNDQSIALPGGMTASITSRLNALVEAPQFYRLGNLRQLSLVDAIYPGATHTRRTHLLHSLEIGRQLLNHLKDSPAFEVNFGQDDALRALATCLLHDLNHFPFLHNVQESVGHLLPNRAVLGIVTDPEHYPPGSGAESFDDALHGVGLDVDSLYRLCFGKHPEQESPADQVISSIVNSGVDVDKISYLLLDGHATGVAYASGLDLSTLLKAANVARLPQSTRLHLAFEDRALQAMEHVYLTRLWNFRSIYWHHTNRALMAMVGTVTAKLFSDAADPLELFTEFFADTMVGGEPVALQWLSARFNRDYQGLPNPIANLAVDRRQIYKRLYTVRPELDGADREIYSTLSDRLLPLSGASYISAEMTLKARVAGLLSSEFYEIGKMDLDPDLDLLIDLPRRRLDSGGDSYVVRPSGDSTLLGNASSIVRHISEDYEVLAKRARFFVSPRVAAALPSRFRVDMVDRLRPIVATAVSELKPLSEGVR